MGAAALAAAPAALEALAPPEVGPLWWTPIRSSRPGGVISAAGDHVPLPPPPAGVNPTFLGIPLKAVRWVPEGYIFLA